MMQAIVYTSNTGFTRRYAQLLAQATGLPLYDLEQAAQRLGAGATICYLGWLMAGRIQGYAKAARVFRIRAVIGVGMAPDGVQVEAVRKANRLPPELPVFTLQGGYDRSRVKGVYGVMMELLAKKLTWEQKAHPDEKNRRMLQMMREGGDWVREESLTPILDWYQSV